jgi:dTDP-4-amino-4,6-dideoxygalactose transaminase
VSLNSSSPATPASPSPIPLLDLRAQLASYRTEALAAIERVVDAQEMIMGPEVGAFERALATYAGVGHALGMSSGTDALLAALMALDVGPGDEVVTTTFSFFATAGVIARLGARPVFTDIDPATFNATPEALRAAVTPRTKAVIPVHLFGQMADVAALAATPGLPPVIEDSAQSLGARLDGRMTGQYGAMTCVSFFPSKNLGGFGGRWRDPHERSRARREAGDPAGPRQQAQVFPPRRRRQLPPRYPAGGGPRREAATPRRLGGRPSA